MKNGSICMRTLKGFGVLRFENAKPHVGIPVIDYGEFSV
ncbi:hypothetical protein AM1_C0342 (plasmid) [Acaryochloris marina MBIC11017]|uniref:Uncharacterized protein n=1 Tax=Acaryochloris marina (strain MBIC 11017) TaxID=329726 RepID=A8ZN70_ACAM1|nr:hypothetical protein AM1_C0342 [Acaryochloris marina MBIC11017]